MHRRNLQQYQCPPSYSCGSLCTCTYDPNTQVCTTACRYWILAFPIAAGLLLLLAIGVTTYICCRRRARRKQDQIERKEAELAAHQPAVDPYGYVTGTFASTHIHSSHCHPPSGGPVVYQGTQPNGTPAEQPVWNTPQDDGAAVSEARDRAYALAVAEQEMQQHLAQWGDPGPQGAPHVQAVMGVPPTWSREGAEATTVRPPSR